MYTDNTCTLNIVSSVRNAIGRSTETQTASVTLPCYLAAENGTRDISSREAVRYTHLLYIPYREDVTDDMTVTIDEIVYEITGVWPAPRKHHLELGLMRLGRG